LLINLRSNRAVFSNWITFLFIFALALSAFFSEIFQAPEHKDTHIDSLRLVFNQGDLENINQIILKNSLGNFHLEKISSDKWKIISPRNLPANLYVIENLLDTLKKLKIRNIYEKDKIYLANFSLNNPLFSLDLIYDSKKEVNVDFGLINPLDNSTYVSVSKQDAIYHIDGFQSNLTSLDLTSFVDTRVFNFDTMKIKKMKIFQGKGPKSKRPSLSLEKKDEVWIGSNGKTLDDNKVTEYLISLENIRSSIILDKISEKLLKKVNDYMEKPHYRLEFEMNNGDNIEIDMSGAIPNLPDLKLEKWQNIIAKSTNGTSPIILNKSNIRNIFIKESKLRKIPFKKLFY
tara:strand:- start:23038 stop:24072 length:1035 start_codon:yes stop_codon:yes gene_type:complete